PYHRTSHHHSSNLQSHILSCHRSRVATRTQHSQRLVVVIGCNSHAGFDLDADAVLAELDDPVIRPARLALVAPAILQHQYLRLGARLRALARAGGGDHRLYRPSMTILAPHAYEHIMQHAGAIIPAAGVEDRPTGQ